MGQVKRATKKTAKAARLILGDVIVVPLEDRRFGLAHVVQMDGKRPGVVLSAFVGARPEALDTAAITP